jgi:probable F420-dependent oxidoreductase
MIQREGHGLQLAYGPWGETFDELLTSARDAQAAGARSLWTAEFDRSGFVQAAAVANVASDARIGTGIALAFVRSPLITALTALDMHDLSHGRFVLGLGTGVRRLNERWHGVEFDHPVDRLRTTIALIREIMATSHRGESIIGTVGDRDIEIRGFRRPHPPPTTQVPVYLGATGPAMTKLTGEIGDGLITLEVGSPAYLRDHILPNLHTGISLGGRDRTDVEIVVSGCCIVDDDAAKAYRIGASVVAFYASVKTYEPLFEAHDFGRECRLIQQRRKAGDVPGMIAACTDEMVHALTLAGTPDDVITSIAQYEGIADEIKLTPPTHLVHPDTTRACQRAIMELIAFGAEPRGRA